MWKRKLHLPGKDKEAARQRALQLFPKHHSLFSRKKDHGRADAALIAVAMEGSRSTRRWSPPIPVSAAALQHAFSGARRRSALVENVPVHRAQVVV